MLEEINTVEEEEERDSCDCCGCDSFAADTLEEIGGSLICESCRDNYYSECEHCGRWTHREELVATLYGGFVCPRCIETHYRYCEECDGYCYDDDDDHEHGSSCDCCSPQLSFSIRNDGLEPLRNDTSVTVELPAGVISEEGLTEITRFLYAAARATESLAERDRWYEMVADLPTLGDTWQAKDGNYTKRLSRLAYKTYGLKLDADTLSAVGNIAAAHSQPARFALEITRDLNLPASDFYHAGSCWWGSYSESRCALKSNGGFGLRSFDREGGYVTGRAWVLPLKKVLPVEGAPPLAPTFDTINADAFVTFNGYGNLSGYTPARILSQMFGMTYRKIAFEASPMYVNAGGYLIAPETIAADYTDGRLYLTLDEHADLYYREQRSTPTHA